jgi:hypothetical protein
MEKTILSKYASCYLLGKLTRLGYLFGTNLEFVDVSKRTPK